MVMVKIISVGQTAAVSSIVKMTFKENKPGCNQYQDHVGWTLLTLDAASSACWIKVLYKAPVKRSNIMHQTSETCLSKQQFSQLATLQNSSSHSWLHCKTAVLTVGYIAKQQFCFWSNVMRLHKQFLAKRWTLNVFFAVQQFKLPI